MANKLSMKSWGGSSQGTSGPYNEASAASSQQFSSGTEDRAGAKPTPGPEEVELSSMLPANQKPVSKNLFSKWWPELTCCFFIIGPFAALFGTIYPYVDKPLPEWPYGLSINTLISIYSIIFTTALMMVVASGLGQLKFLWFQDIRRLSDLETFDQAAKGPWGALLLLWVLRERHLLSSIGALVVVLTVFVAPFSQQLIKYKDCVRVDGDLSTIPRTNIISTTGGLHVGAGMSNVDILAQAAVNTGLYDSNPAEVKPTCATGNCTFATEYLSAGYCHECRDYTDQVVKNGTKEGVNMTVSGWDIGSDGYMYALTLGQSLSGYPGVRMIYSTIDETTRNNTDNCSGGRLGGNWTCLGIGAAECSIRPCIRKYSGNVLKGAFTEEVKSMTTDFPNATETGSLTLSLIDMSCVGEPGKRYLRNNNYNFSDDAEWLKYNLSLPIFSESYNESDIIPDRCIYQADQIDILSLSSFFTEYFTGYVSVTPRTGGEGTSIPGRALYNLGQFNFTYVDNKFKNLAQSLTVYARNKGSGSNESEPTHGENERTKVCVGVRWQWITLEAFLLIAGLGFFVITVWVVERTGDDTVNHDYKTSVLPLLFHGLDSHSASRNAQSMSSVESQAKNIRVKLTKDETGWGFVDADGQSLRSAK